MRTRTVVLLFLLPFCVIVASIVAAVTAGATGHHDLMRPIALVGLSAMVPPIIATIVGFAAVTIVRAGVAGGIGATALTIALAVLGFGPGVGHVHEDLVSALEERRNRKRGISAHP